MVAKVRRLLWIYRRLLGAHIQAALQYEADFWLLIGGSAIMQIVGVVFLSVIFTRIPTLNGWSFWDVVLIYAMVTLAEAVGPLFFEGMWHLAWRINRGELDYLVTRPYPVVAQVTADRVGFNGFGNLATGVILLVLAIPRSSIEWSPVTIAFAVVLFVSALAIRLSISLATNAISFWVAGPYGFAYALHQVGDLARYPITIYTVAVRFAIGLVIPFAFASYFPVAALRGEGIDARLGLLTPLVAIWCVAVALVVFRRGLRRYESAGN